MTVMVGDATGAVFTYSKGNFDADTAVYIASATKLIFGLAVWQLVDDGLLARGDNPQDYISFWTDVAGDGRSEITLDQLLGFVSGFNAPSTAHPCISDGTVSLSDCVRSIYEDGLDTLPGAGLYYGPEHMQIAALMMQEVGAKPAPDIMRDVLFDPLGVSATTRFTANLGDNPRYAGSLIPTANDVALILTGVLDGSLIMDLSGYLEDRTGMASIGRRPDTIDELGFDWHYGWGFWLECDAMSFQADCLTQPTISSPGAFGFTPWVDFETDYWGIIAMEEVSSQTFSPTRASVELEQELQPLIEAALDVN